MAGMSTLVFIDPVTADRKSRDKFSSALPSLVVTLLQTMGYFNMATAYKVQFI